MKLKLLDKKKKLNQMMKFLLLILQKLKSQEPILLESIKEILRFIKFKNQKLVFTSSNINFQKKLNDKTKFFNKKMMILMMKLTKVLTLLKLLFLET